MLKIAYDEVRNNADAVISLKTEYAYRLTNKAYATLSMAVETSDDEMFALTTAETDAQLWYFEASDTEGRYYLKNKSTGKYPGNVTSGAVLKADKTKDGAYAYELRDMGQGVWALVGNTGLHCSASQSYNIVGWGADADATQWYIIAVEVDDIAEARYELEYLMQKTEAMMAEVGKVAVGETETVTLTESNYYCNATYTGDNGDKFTSYRVLYDGDANSYLHTDYDSNTAPSNEDHYIRIDMGDGKGLQYFNLNYTTRGSGNVCAPTKMAIEVSNDATTWVTLRDITSGLPTANNTPYTIEGLGYGTLYRYVRMRVYGNSTNGPVNGHNFFVVSELGLSEIITYAETLNSTYTSMTEGVLLDAFKANLAAQGVLITATTSAEYKAAYTTLETKYNALLAAKKVVDDAALKAKKDELETLIDDMKTLISSCGTVTYTPATYSGDVALQVHNSTGDFYLTTNSQQSNVLSVGNLLDNKTNTYYHSSWSAAADDDHYLQVNLGEGKGLAEFTFTYTTRESTDPSPAPTKIQVYGSNDGESFEALLATFTSSDEDNALPAYNEWATEWTSTSIKGAESYDYLRFYVREAQGPGTNEVETNGHHYFAMSEFSLTAIGTPESYTVELGNDAGGATNALMLAAYKENASAQATHTLATTLSQVEEAIAKLQADYDALKSAKESTVEKTYYVQVVGGNANGGVVYGGNSYVSSASFEAPINLTVADLTAISLDGYAEPVVTLNGTTITVTYNKIYTVQVAGVQDAGGVSFGGNDYAHNATITVLQDIDEAQLTAKDVDGYDAGVITVNHETKVITVTYTLVDTEKFYTLECLSEYAHSTERFISDNGAVIDGRSAAGTRFSFEKANDANGYYMRSMISGKYLNHANGAVYASTEKNTVWTMAKPTHTPAARTLTVGDNLYLNNNGSDCTNESCTNLQSNLHESGVGSGNACSLWTLVAYDEPYDKTELNTLLAEVKDRVASCYTDEVFNYTGSIYVTEELMTATDAKVADAQTACDDKTTAKVVYDAALEALQTAKTNLEYAIARAWLPVILTTDIKNPVLYTIKSKRGNTKVLQYEPASDHMFSVAEVAANSAKQAFFFMESDVAAQVYVYPFAAGEKVLAADDIAEGAGRVSAKERGATYEKWTFIKQADDAAAWYNLQPVGTSTYLNHYGNQSDSKMGFYPYYPSTDSGSLFQFESTTVEGSGAYNSLKVYYDEATKVKSSEITGDNGVGYYPVAEADAYNTAYATATSLVTNNTSSYDEYLAAYDALLAANEALEINMPEEGKYYRFVSADVTNNRVDGVVYANPADNKMYWSKDKATTDATAIWTIVPANNGTFHISNLHTGTSISSFINNNPSPLSETAGEAGFVSISTDGQLKINCSGTMHAQAGGAIVTWNTGANDASAWRIVEVEPSLANVKFDMTIGEYGHAGLYLNYSVLIPAAVKAYIIDGSDVEIEDGEGSLTLKQIEGSVLPAKTAVILEAEPNSYSFYYTENEANVGTNLLTGSAYQTYREAETNHNYYIFGHKEGVVGLYKNSVVYDATGAEGDTHYKMSANKVLFDWDNSAGNVNAFRFRIDGEETGIEEVTVGAEDTIYDLYGRRLVEVNTSGLYIVNGEKRYVKVK